MIISHKKLTPVQIADVIRACGYIMQVRDIGHEVIIPYIYALSDHTGKGVKRCLGTLEEVSAMRRGKIRATIFSAFLKARRRKEPMSHYDAIDII